MLARFAACGTHQQVHPLSSRSLNLETAVGQVQVGFQGVGWQGATAQRAHARQERSDAAGARPGGSIGPVGLKEKWPELVFAIRAIYEWRARGVHMNAWKP